MNLEDYAEKIDNLIRTLPEVLQDEAIASAGRGLVRRMKDRIFNQGLDRENRIIGEDYSTKPIYVPKERFARPSAFRPQGKNAKGKKREDGTERKTMYLPGGYKELKQVQGLVYDRINLVYKGDLRRAFISEFREGVLYIGFNSELQAKKREWIEAMFGKVIFTASDEEMLEYRAAVIRHLQRVRRENLSA